VRIGKVASRLMSDMSLKTIVTLSGTLLAQVKFSLLPFTTFVR